MSTGLYAALQREMDAVYAVCARRPERIRLSDDALPGAIVGLPLVEDNELGRARAAIGLTPSYEILVHPSDWERLVLDFWVPIIEVNMREDGAGPDEIAAASADALAHPELFRFCGLPVAVAP